MTSLITEMLPRKCPRCHKLVRWGGKAPVCNPCYGALSAEATAAQERGLH